MPATVTGLTFERLRSTSPLLPALAQAHFDEWGHLRAQTRLERVQGRLARECDSVDLPAVYVASIDGELVAAANLVANDYLNPQSGRTPFITGVYVAPAYRKQGFVRAMLEHVEAVAAARGFTATHLDCQPQLECMYRHLGYAAIDVREYRQHLLALMRKPLKRG